jgi:hypothetical protein
MVATVECRMTPSLSVTLSDPVFGRPAIAPTSTAFQSFASPDGPPSRALAAAICTSEASSAATASCM